MLADVLPKALFDRVYTAANDPYFTPPDPGFLPTWNGRTGEHIKDIPLLRMYRVSRRRFRTLCSEGIEVEVSGRPCRDQLILFLTLRSMARTSKTSVMTTTRTQSPQFSKTALPLRDLCLSAQTGHNPLCAGPFSVMRRPRRCRFHIAV